MTSCANQRCFSPWAGPAGGRRVWYTEAKPAGRSPHPKSSLDTDVVSHTDTGKEAGSSKPNREHNGGGAETSPSSGQGRSWTDGWESPAFPGPSAKADPEPRGPNPDRPHHLPTSPSPTSGHPLHHPTSAGWPALPTLLLGPEALASLPPPTLHAPPVQARSVFLRG